MASFNLLTEPWIPASDQAGEVREYGILDVLTHARELTGLVDPAPPIQFGLYRLLIAFVMDALSLKELEDLRDHLRGGTFAVTTLTKYAEEVGWHRFDLFHPTEPFLQTTPIAGDEEKRKSIADGFFHLPSGTNVTHFHHRSANAQAIAPAVCARTLCAFAPFMTAGGAGYSPSINGTPPWYVLIRGQNLFETLLLNCYVAEDMGLDGHTPPVWRNEQPLTPRHERDCDSLVQGLTWRPRQIRLLPGEGGTCTYTGKHCPVLVRQMVYGPGDKFKADDTWTDPQVAYSWTDKGRLPLRPREEREPWRDTGPLLMLRKEDYVSENGHVRFSRPLVMDQFRQIRRIDNVQRSRPERVEIYGMRADKAKVFEWWYERLVLPVGVDENPRAGMQVQQAMQLADSVAYALRSALKKAYPRGGSGNEKALERLIQGSQFTFWAQLHEHFDGLLESLAGQDPDDLDAQIALATQWKAELRTLGWHNVNQALEPLDTGAEALQRQVSVRSNFAAALSRLLEPRPSEAKSKSKEGRKQGA